MAKVKPRWTVVQHSACGYNNDQTFARSIEARQIDKLADQQLVVKAGGKLFDSYDEATAYEESHGEARGLYQIVPGTFSEHQIDGLKIYVPPA